MLKIDIIIFDIKVDVVYLRDFEKKKGVLY